MPAALFALAASAPRQALALGGNIAVLLGAEFNAELERGRRIEGGQREDREPFVEPRDTRKMKDS